MTEISLIVTLNNQFNSTQPAFFEHFRDLSGTPTSDEAVDTDIDSNDTVFHELDAVITSDEIRQCIKGLKRGKSHGDDCILNEFLIEFCDILLPFFVKMFNVILHTGFFPTTWSSAVIVPVFKKGDTATPNNYRGISLISCICKLFTSVLNKRLLAWSNENEIITDAQFGFRPKSGTSEAIFALHYIINRTLCKKRRLYCCFVDYKKAFDSVDRKHLWCKLSKFGICGKLLNVVKSMYANVKSCVTIQGLKSEYFRSSLGLMQGEVLSPILFSLYVNDFEIEFIKNGCTSIELQNLHLFILMYADDMVLFSESVDGLQNMLDVLYDYTKQWNLEVNIQKTKIVIFRNGGQIRQNENWLYDGCQIEVLNQFTYLGIVLNYNGKFLATQKQLAAQGRKALFALRANITDMSLNHCTMFSLFDTYVSSILNYGCEVWGSHRAHDIEKVHLDFCKNILGVTRRTNNVMVYIETGRLPLRFVRLIRMFKFWFKLLTSENCILREIYSVMFNECENPTPPRNNWLFNIKEELSRLGLAYLWHEQKTLSLKVHFPVIRQRIIDHCVQSLFADMCVSQKCIVYKHLVDHFCLQFYLCKPIPVACKKQICKIRMSSHNLFVESGRSQNIPRSERICQLCNLDIEDEFHFVLKCPVYCDLRKKYIKHYYWRRPSVFKLVQLLSVNNVKELCSLGKIRDAFKLRSSLLP